MKLWRSVILFVFVSLSLFLDIVEAQKVELPSVYFSEIQNGEIVPQLLVLEKDGQPHNVFTSNNDGYFESLSPDGSHLSLLRAEWGAPTREATSQIWLAHLDTGEQWAIGTQMATAGGLWSPDSSYYLLNELQAVAPLWTGYNYGYQSLYRISDKSIFKLDGLYAFAMSWYPDSKNVLFWNYETGYFRYDVENHSKNVIRFEGVSSESPAWVSISPTESVAAIPLENGIGLYNAETGSELQLISQSMLANMSPIRLYWSPDGNYFAITLNNGSLAIWDYQANELITMIDPSMYSLGYSHTLEWSTTPQNLFLIVSTSDGVTIHQIEPSSGHICTVYRTYE